MTDKWTKDMTMFPAIHGLHHFAWRCRNAEETRVFYEDVLGLPLVHVIQQDQVPWLPDYLGQSNTEDENYDDRYYVFGNNFFPHLSRDLSLKRRDARSMM